MDLGTSTIGIVSVRDASYSGMPTTTSSRRASSSDTRTSRRSMRASRASRWPMISPADSAANLLDEGALMDMITITID